MIIIVTIVKMQNVCNLTVWKSVQISDVISCILLQCQSKKKRMEKETHEQEIQNIWIYTNVKYKFVILDRSTSEIYDWVCKCFQK